MKAKLTLLIIILSFALIGQVVAQGYTPFDFKRSIWNYGTILIGSVACGSSQICTLANDYSSIYAKDTVLSGKRYVYIKQDRPFPYPTIFREDTSMRVLYAWDIWTQKDTLMYDFNLRIGDTLQPCYYGSGQIYSVVSIDSVYVLRKYHRRFRLMPDIDYYGLATTSNYLIEGIGGTTGLGVSAIVQLQLAQQRHPILTCFRGQNVINTSIVGLCDTIVSLKGQQNESPDTRLKNPYLSHEPIELPEDCKDVTMVNSLGQQVPITVESANSTVLVRMSIANSGMYWVNYSTSVGVFRKKVVVTQ